MFKKQTKSRSGASSGLVSHLLTAAILAAGVGAAALVLNSGEDQSPAQDSALSTVPQETVAAVVPGEIPLSSLAPVVVPAETKPLVMGEVPAEVLAPAVIPASPAQTPVAVTRGTKGAVAALVGPAKRSSTDTTSPADYVRPLDAPDAAPASVPTAAETADSSQAVAAETAQPADSEKPDGSHEFRAPAAPYQDATRELEAVPLTPRVEVRRIELKPSVPQSEPSNKPLPKSAEQKAKVEPKAKPEPKKVEPKKPEPKKPEPKKPEPKKAEPRAAEPKRAPATAPVRPAQSAKASPAPAPAIAASTQAVPTGPALAGAGLQQIPEVPASAVAPTNLRMPPVSPAAAPIVKSLGGNDAARPAEDAGARAPSTKVLNNATVGGQVATVVAKSPDGSKAWLRVGDQRTVIVSKGQAVPGLGTFRGVEGKCAQFESGCLPVIQ